MASPLLWKLAQEKGNISTEEMLRVFNMGIGMIAIVDKDLVPQFQEAIPEGTFVIGELVYGGQKLTLR